MNADPILYKSENNDFKSSRYNQLSHISYTKSLNKPFPEFEILSEISKAKFSVYLIFCHALGKHFALKIFPYNDSKISHCFLTETRFSSLDHPNIIKMVSSKSNQETIQDEKILNVSYLIMEFAPYGDFFSVVAVRKFLFDEKLVRTYFRQLISGLEYLHAKGVCHLDLKLENLLLGENFVLKIGDFDLSYKRGDSKIRTQGTKFYRAPELMELKCTNMEAVDVYSAGILLFVFRTGGVLPHSETKRVKNICLFDLLADDNQEFWEKHCEIQKKPSHFFSLEFRSLFNAMTKVDPRERITISEIKKTKWYNGPVYNQTDIEAIFENLY